MSSPAWTDFVTAAGTSVAAIAAAAAAGGGNRAACLTAPPAGMATARRFHGSVDRIRNESRLRTVAEWRHALHVARTSRARLKLKPNVSCQR